MEIHERYVHNSKTKVISFFRSGLIQIASLCRLGKLLYWENWIRMFVRWGQGGEGSRIAWQALYLSYREANGEVIVVLACNTIASLTSADETVGDTFGEETGRNTNRIDKLGPYNASLDSRP